ncbi:MAG TPA: diacylglycerol kinase family protein [Rhizomicrobium sp.]|nr:diacylglycerol kinase family protein [Rhizomicrobium sp.]
MSAFVVVNPRSGNRRTQREWPAIERGLRSVWPQITVAHTGRQAEATSLVRDALREGFAEIVAIGGDGTINEAMNGFFDDEGPIAPDAVFSFVTSGTGGDFRKTFGIAPGSAAAIARLKTAGVMPVDVGRVSCLTASGAPCVHHFINIASFGLSGAVVDSVNRARVAKLFGGQFAFVFHSALDMLAYRDRAVRIRIDGQFDEVASISTVVIANGQYFGGGMRVAPDARPDDGLFDIVIMGGSTKRQALTDMKLIYAGEHLNLPNVRVLRGRSIVAAPVAESRGRSVLIEMDGENGGQLPATFEILPNLLKMRC